jgi:hypothetical protein
MEVTTSDCAINCFRYEPRIYEFLFIKTRFLGFLFELDPIKWQGTCLRGNFE